MMSGYPVSYNAEALPRVIVTGEGRVDATPDTVLISLGFSARAETASAAYQQTAAAMNQVVRALLELGIRQEQLQTDHVSLQPVYEKEQLVGYEGASTLRVTLRDPSAAGQVIDRAVSAGANSVRGVSFEVRDPSPYDSAALAAAVQDAQRQAIQLAQSLGARLGPLWRAEADPAPGPIVPIMVRAVASEALPVLPGTVQVSRRVRVEYLLQR